MRWNNTSDCAGAARVLAKLTELAKGLEHDPQVEGLLLGIYPKTLQFRSIAPRSTYNTMPATCSGKAAKSWTMQPDG